MLSKVLPRHLVYGTVMILMILDVHSTLTAERLCATCYEANPIARGPVENWHPLALYGFKIGFVLAAFAIWSWAERRHERKNGRPPSILLYIPAGLLIMKYTEVVINNYSLAGVI